MELLRPPARDQGELRCCVSVATVAAMECRYLREGTGRSLSAMFHFRIAGGGANTDLQLAAGPRVAAYPGVCTAGLWPDRFDESGLADLPHPAHFQDALRSRSIPSFATGEQYRAVHPSPMGIRQHLLGGYAVVCAFRQTLGYAEVLAGAATHGDDLEGGSGILHAVAAVGYSVQRRALRILDSRGPDVGADGTWWLPDRLVGAIVVNAFSFFGVTNG